jgi:hypothetical protein
MLIHNITRMGQVTEQLLATEEVKANKEKLVGQ